MSQVEDTIQSVQKIRESYNQTLAQISESITAAEQGAEQAEALGFEGIIEIYVHAKQGLEELVQATGGLGESVDAIVEILEAGKSGG